MSWKQIIFFFRREWGVISFIVLTILAASFFTWLQGAPSFPDPDSFYHIKSSQYIIERGVITEFPWLSGTVLRDTYIDQHFLYHLFLVPFVTLLPPFVGVKLATVIITSAVILLFYWLLRRFRVPYAFVFAALLLATMPFIFRMNLVKAPGFSIIFLLLGIYFIFQHKHVALFILSFLYVWAYGGFILIVVFSGLYAVIGILQYWLKQPAHITFFHVLRHSRELRLFFSSLGGVLAGIVVNPYFPENVVFYWHQLVKIGIINYQAVIPVGNEWYPYKFIDLMANTAFVSILVVIVLYLFAVRFVPPHRRTVMLGCVALFFFIFTLKSRRYVEYYVPFALLFTAFALRDQWFRASIRKLSRQLRALWNKYRVLIIIIGAYVILAVPAIVVKDVRHTYRDFQGGIPLDRFAESSRWLAAHSQKGDIVFHSSWDEFPMLWYYNDINYYIAGLDPTFAYEYDAELYKAMVRITLGEQTEGVYQDIKERFKARYVFVENNHTAMDRVIRQESGFAEVYQDDETTIYEVN